jgi:hypothetical protein
MRHFTEQRLFNIRAAWVYNRSLVSLVSVLVAPVPPHDQALYILMSFRSVETHGCSYPVESRWPPAVAHFAIDTGTCGYDHNLLEWGITSQCQNTESTGVLCLQLPHPKKCLPSRIPVMPSAVEEQRQVQSVRNEHKNKTHIRNEGFSLQSRQH